ncbi:MAG: hypothetical protein EAZ08_10105 [Cytophagales bacterium]|nr:MAG: hypothetical protein EAZ08_10105 [Cytophagales bacterium]
MLNGDATFAINFDRLQYHPQKGYIIFEFLLCDEKQTNVSPHTSHPSKYWHKNSQKFINLFRVSQALNAILYLVNYAKTGTKHENEIRVIEVLAVDETGITQERTYETTRQKFSASFRKLNMECGL